MRTYEEIAASDTFSDDELKYAILCLDGALSAMVPMGSRYVMVRDDMIRVREQFRMIAHTRGLRGI